MTQNRNVILAIDEGTSGTRAAVVAADGHVSCLEYTTLQVDSPRPGVVEQDANVLLEKTLAVCRATLAQAARDHLNVVALAIATQRATAVLWDTQTGRALVPAMVWQDTRYAAGPARSWRPRGTRACVLPSAGLPACVRPTSGRRGTCARRPPWPRHGPRAGWPSARWTAGCSGTSPPSAPA